MTGGVDQVDQEVVAVGLLALDVLGVLRLGEGGVQGDGSRLDGDTTCLMSAHFVLASNWMDGWMGRKPGRGTYAPARQHEYRWHEHHQPFRWR